MLRRMKVLIAGFVLSTLVLVKAGVPRPLLCRCEHEEEHLYSRRLVYYHPDTTSYEIDVDGYFVLEGLRVLPSYEEPCSGELSFLSNLFNRNLGAKETKDDTSSDAAERYLKSKGSKNKRSKNNTS